MLGNCCLRISAAFNSEHVFLNPQVGGSAGVALPHVFHLSPGTREPRGYALLLQRVNAQVIHRVPLKLCLELARWHWYQHSSQVT